MKVTKLIVIATVLLLACQLFAQTPSYVQRLAAYAQATGQPQRVMPTAPPHHMRSFIWVAGTAPDGNAQTKPANCNTGGYNFCPPSLEIAYGSANVVGGNQGAGTTIAIVDAFHYANNEADFNQFNSDMGLPLCTTQNGCFTNTDQNGGQNFCGADSGWELETMLDIEWAHAMAPNAKILLVEGCTNDDSDLYTAIGTAVTKLGANFVSNSWGESEFDGETEEDQYYNYQVPLLFASGDGGAPAIYPCVSPYVTCVGGTDLTLNETTFQRITETGWPDSGGGCSVYESSVSFQTGNGVNVCGANRAAPDVAAIAGTPIYIYDSGNGGYVRVEGTSVATPVTAGMYADVEAARLTFPNKPRFQQMGAQLYHPYKLYSTPGSNYLYFYFDVLTGNNGHAAGPGYDLVTGLGVSVPADMANPFFGLQ
jgi:subtilase family serine protease